MTAADLPPPPTRRDVLGPDLGLASPDRSGDGTAGTPRWRFHRSRSSHVLHSLGTWAAKASAGVTVAGVLLAWGVLGAFTAFPHWWEISLYSSTSAVTVVMLFAVQHTQHREQVVTQRKLDELLRAQPGADDLLIAAESAGDAELEDLVGLRPDDARAQALAAALQADDVAGS